ncbi:MAG: carboxymuconolactone decarboxylase [Rhodospirillales bacterium]|jgi:4-carboxymuconolactone decarboxylase|nr:carboxymuconolactone decarboxylase [Rhodospirillales bacterium]
MTRIGIIKRDDMNAEQGRVYDAAQAAGGPLGGPYWAYIRNPKLFAAAQEMGAVLRDGPLSGRERQIAVLTVVRHWGAKYPWAVQVRGSLAAGVDQATIDAINERRAPPLTDPREKAAHDVARELLADHKLSDATYAAAEKAYGVEALVSLVAAIGQFSMVCCSANAFDITPPDDVPARLAP